MADGVVYFSDSADQRVYRQRPGDAPVPMTPDGAFQYGSKVFNRRLGRIICIRGNHTDPEEDHPLSEIVSLDPDGLNETRVLLAGNDFHSSTCISHDRKQLAWLTWDHPNMPWDGTDLWVAPLDAVGGLGEPTFVAGGIDEAVVQPEWSPAGSVEASQ